MSKKKILSILIIGLIVLGTVLFVANNLQAKSNSNDEFDACFDYCWDYYVKTGFYVGDCVAMYCVKKL